MHALAPSRPDNSNLQTKALRLIKGPAFGKITSFNSPGDSSEDWPVFRHDNERSGKASTKISQYIKQAWKIKIGKRLSSPVAAKGRIYISEIDVHTIHAIDAVNGKSLWSFTANGRIDSPPTIYGNMILFGSADGWVYCLRETDGTLIWKYRAAPQERMIVVRGQLESVWPVHGSVLIQNNTIIASAGRSSYIDGGIYITKLDPRTGKKISETRINSLDPKTGEQPPGGADLRGVLNDILTSSGDSVYMRHLKINFETGDDLQIGNSHLFAPVGFLDDNWWHRSYWIYGSDPVCMPPSNESGFAIWPRVGNMLPSGRILSLSQNSVFGYGRDKYPHGMRGQFKGGEKYHIFGAEKEAFEPLPSNKKNQHLRATRSGKELGLKATARDKAGGGPSLHNYLWSRDIPIYVRAMVLTDTVLFLAGPLEPEDAKNSGISLENPEKIEAAFSGKQGVKLYVVSTQNGDRIAEYKLDSSPIFDGMIAAQSRIIMALEDGTLVCYEE